jgi:nucleoside-diphosphate-sugar epimerase
MRVFLAGASGAIGSRLVPQSIEHGHEVVGLEVEPRPHDSSRATPR